MPISPALRSFVVSVLAIAGLTLVAWLSMSAFFTAWDGRAISVAPPCSPEARAMTVRVVDDAGGLTLVRWESEVVRALKLPVDPVEVPPRALPESAARTQKRRFSLSYTVEMPTADGARAEALPSTNPRTLATAALGFFVLIGLRNMVVARHPLRIAPAPAPPGGPSEAPRSSRGRGSRPGPPPPGRRRGVGRR